MLDNPSELPLHIDFCFRKSALQRVALSPAPKFSYAIHSSCSTRNLLEQWLENYLKGIHLPPPLTLALSHLSPFSQHILKAIQAVPFGETATYQGIAKTSGHAQACRAAGNICHNNPYPMLIPCHRIIRSNGQIGGFALGSQLKTKLLAFEHKVKKLCARQKTSC
ncbi:MAG: MGMT family protein [Chlamydiota bacterium]